MDHNYMVLVEILITEPYGGTTSTTTVVLVLSPQMWEFPIRQLNWQWELDPGLIQVTTSIFLEILVLSMCWSKAD
jgi:hypothetical protein